MSEIDVAWSEASWAPAAESPPLPGKRSSNGADAEDKDWGLPDRQDIVRPGPWQLSERKTELVSGPQHGQHETPTGYAVFSCAFVPLPFATQ